jgi:hypothetical protein
MPDATKASQIPGSKISNAVGQAMAISTNLTWSRQRRSSRSSGRCWICTRASSRCCRSRCRWLSPTSRACRRRPVLLLPISRFTSLFFFLRFALFLLLLYILLKCHMHLLLVMSRSRRAWGGGGTRSSDKFEIEGDPRVSFLKNLSLAHI